MAHTPQEQERLKQIINEGIQVTQEISYLQVEQYKLASVYFRIIK